MKTRNAEQDLARCVVDYFGKLPGWRLHHEVAVKGSVADFVATNGLLTHVIEVKCAQSLSLLDQALGWINHAHLVSVAVPASRRRSQAFLWMLRQMGAGCFELRPTALGGYGEPCREKIRPKLCRTNSGLVERHLREEQTRPEDWAHAGSASGGHFTPFRATCKEVQNFVARNPGCTMKEIVQGIQHHYASDAGARSSLTTWIREGLIPGVEKGEVGYVPTQP